MFLDSVRERQEEEERQRKEKDGEEVRNFKECVSILSPDNITVERLVRAVAARTSAVNNPPLISSNLLITPVGPTKPPPPPVVRKDPKRALKGVVVKRKAKTTSTIKVPPEVANKDDSKEDGDRQPDTKRRKLSQP